MRWQDAREFFEDARKASADALRCAHVLEQLDEIATKVGGASFDVHVSGTNKDRLERAVIKCAETERKLHARIERDYQLIDLANAVIYGSPQVDGIADVVRPTCQWWADVVYQHFLGLHDFAEVAALLGHSRQYCGKVCADALDACDRYHLIAVHVRHHDAEGWSVDV